MTRRILATMTTLFLALLLTAPVQAATPTPLTFHVTGVEDHIRTRDEEPGSKALHTRIYRGAIGERRYTIHEAIVLFSPGSHFEVGEDYEVLELGAGIGKRIKVNEHPDKKGKVRTEWLTIDSIEEIPK